ncbi:MAG TPA: hypothetical protein VGH30_10320, partial [Jatrophihabitantaceae bacterium]
NASRTGDEVWDDLVTVGRTTTVADVVWLLGDRGWRPAVMGAWLSLRFRRDEVDAPLLQALRESRGSLTAPPLAVAVVMFASEGAEAALHETRARTDDASIPYLDAALERLGADPMDDVSTKHRAVFDALVSFAERLRAALSAE